MSIIKSAFAAFLFFLGLFLNKQERQAAIGALSVIGSHRGTTGRALTLFGQFVRSPEFRMDFPEVFRNALPCPFKVLLRYDQPEFIMAMALVTAGIGSDRARNTSIDENVVQFAQPLQIALPDYG